VSPSRDRHDATDALFSKARRLDAPDAGARDRMRRAVLERAAMAGAGVGTAAIATSLASAPVTKAATWSAALVAKIVVPLLLVGTAVTGAVTLSVPVLSAAPSFESPSRAAQPSTQHPEQERAIDRAPRAVVALDASHVATPAATSRAAVALRASAPSADPDDAARADLRDLQEVERFLARGNAEAALVMLDARPRASSSVFAEELEGARVLALCASTRSDEAARARSTFVARHPVSPLVRRIERACAAPEK
jgi:hypothetical protein